MIEARALSFIAGQKKILDDVSLVVEPGEVVAIVGPNGAGKSTLLRGLCGEWQPVKGSIWMDGRRLADWPSQERARRLAVLPQHSRLEFEFLVEEVVLMGRIPHATRRESARDTAITAEAMRRVGVSDLAGQVYPTLSGGEQQRVQLARVLAQLGDEGRYVLLDEPLASLDLKHQHAILQLLVELAKDGLGVLVVTHDLRLARRYAHRVVVMRQGTIVAAGATDQVLTAPVVAAVYEVSNSVAAETI